jgi:PKD repeat protein
LITGYSDYASIGQYSITGTLVASSTEPQPPVAVISTSPNSNPLTVNFSSSNSSDPDGTIVGYAWDFGDGTTSTEANPVKTYGSAGTYTATLTVTDNSGLTGTTSAAVSVQQNQIVEIFVNSITMSLVKSGRNTAAQAVITVYDNNGAPRSGVTVSGRWSGLVTGNVTGTTNSSGQVAFTSSSTKNKGTFTFTVTNLSASGYTYNSTLNKETSDSISY